MTSKLFPLALNELLDRPLSLPFNVALAFLLRCSSRSSLFREACLTLELTGREDNADRFKLTMKDKLTRAPVE
jgi:hypothetical protein